MTNGKEHLLNSLRKLLPPEAPDHSPVEADDLKSPQDLALRLNYIEARLTWQRRVILALAGIIAYMANKILNLGLDLDHLITILSSTLK